MPLLVAASKLVEEDVLVAVEAARGQRLLEEASDSSYRFVHDVIPEVAEADLGPGRRTILHRRIAVELERQLGATSLDRLAYHYARSDIAEKAVKYLRRAADQARAQHANTAAVDYYQKLVERLERQGDAVTAAGVREQWGAVLVTMAEYDAALGVLEQAVSAYDASSD